MKSPVFVLLLVAWLSGAVLAGTDESPVVASVGDAVIHVADLEREMARQAGGRPGAFEAPEQRRALLDEMIREKMVVVAARRAGYAEDPEIVAATERMMAARYLQDEMAPAPNGPEVPAEEVRAWYDGHAELYTLPARVQGAILRLDVAVGSSEEQRRRLRARAEEALARARELPPDAPGFGPLALEYSDDRGTRYVGGSIGWLTAGRSYPWPAPVVDALLALERPGDVGPIVETKGALWVPRLMQRRDEQLRALDSVENEIRHELEQLAQHRRRERLQRKLAAAVDVRVDEAALTAVPAPSIEDPRNTPPPSMASQEENRP